MITAIRYISRGEQYFKKIKQTRVKFIGELGVGKRNLCYHLNQSNCKVKWKYIEKSSNRNFWALKKYQNYFKVGVALNMLLI